MSATNEMGLRIRHDLEGNVPVDVIDAELTTHTTIYFTPEQALQVASSLMKQITLALAVK